MSVETNYEQMSDEELRRAVAERLGWKAIRFSWGGVCGYAPENPFPHEQPMMQVPRFAEDIRAAWGLIWKMREMGMFGEIGFGPNDDGGWYVGIGPLRDRVDHEYQHEVNAKTAPRAICIAYLKATESAHA